MAKTMAFAFGVLWVIIPYINNMSLRNPNIPAGIELPPSEVEEAILDQHPLIASAFLHPDDPRHLEFKDVQAAVFEAEEMAAAAGFGL